MCLLVAAPLAVAQDSGLPDKDMLAKVLDALVHAGRTDNVVRFYDATSPFPFDVAPLKFDDFPAYMTASRRWPPP